MCICSSCQGQVASFCGTKALHYRETLDERLFKNTGKCYFRSAQICCLVWNRFANHGVICKIWLLDCLIHGKNQGKLKNTRHHQNIKHNHAESCWFILDTGWIRLADWNTKREIPSLTHLHSLRACDHIWGLRFWLRVAARCACHRVPKNREA